MKRFFGAAVPEVHKQSRYEELRPPTLSGTTSARIEFASSITELSSVPVLPRLVHGAQVILGMDFLDTCADGTMFQDHRRVAANTTSTPFPEGTPECLSAFGEVFAEPTHLLPVRPGVDVDILLKPDEVLSPLKPILL